MVRTGTSTLEEVDGAEAPTPAVAAAITVTITETSRSQNVLSKEKMKDGPISELTIIETGYRPSQFKKLYDALPVFCADKNYSGLDEVLRTRHDQVERDFMLAYPNPTLWSHTHQIQVATVADGAALAKGSLIEHVVTYKLMNKTIVTDANLKKQLLSDYKRNSKLKS